MTSSADTARRRPQVAGQRRPRDAPRPQRRRGRRPLPALAPRPGSDPGRGTKVCPKPRRPVGPGRPTGMTDRTAKATAAAAGRLADAAGSPPRSPSWRPRPARHRRRRQPPDRRRRAAARRDGSQARTSIEQMLSYNYKTIDAQSAQIEGLLTGSFKTEFATAMDRTRSSRWRPEEPVRRAGPGGRRRACMSSTSRTVKVHGLRQPGPGRPRPEPSRSSTRTASIATLSKVGDRWLISRLTAY